MTTVSVDRTETIWWVGLNRPDKRNALNQEMVDELQAILLDAGRDRCIIVIHSTTPGIFASGADITELAERDADSALMAINAGLFDKLEAHRWPTIALVDGPALGGGCELALACDFRIASDSAIFGQPELALGIIAGAGGNWRLAELVGLSTARKMLYTGARLSAKEAHAVGLVDFITADLRAAGTELARAIAEQSWRALEMTKLALRSRRSSTTLFDLAAQAFLFESEDKRLRMQNFLQRRR
jgi:enoyl-CoA hydratase